MMEEPVNKAKIGEIFNAECLKCIHFEEKIKYIKYWNIQNKPVLRLLSILLKSTFD
jgi:hypothetical protein